MERKTELEVLRRVCFGLTACGWTVSAYMLFRMGAIGVATLPLPSALHAGPVSCRCDDALANTASFVRGLPLPTLELICFAVIGATLAFGGPRSARSAFLMGAIAAGGIAHLSVRFVLSGEPICILYPILSAVSVALVAALFASVRRQPPGDRSPSLSKAWFTVGIGLIAGALLAQFAIRGGPDSNQIIKQHRAGPLYEIPRQKSDPVLGARNGRARLIVFSSLQCSWCRRLAPTLAYLGDHFADDLTIVFKHFPLGTDCNPSLTYDIQPKACAAALAAEAANSQNAFWRYHDALLSNPSQGFDESIETAARHAQLDISMWQSDRQSQAVRLRVSNDVQFGLRLGIAETPVVFLDGRRVHNPSLIVLATLIREQIQRRR